MQQGGLKGVGGSLSGYVDRGAWTRREKKLHINALEMIAAELAIKTFTKGKEVKSIHLRVDNTTALHYIANKGGTKSEDLIAIAKRIWQYLLSRGITLTVEYVPSKLNVMADWESRNTWDSSEWKLNPAIFQKICLVLGKPQIDLFASRVSHQLPRYMSRKKDPCSVAQNALQQNWSHMFPYAFPPFNLIGQTLQKVKKHSINMIIITPVWAAQPWYPQILEMTIHNPILLPQMLQLLSNPQGETHPLLNNNTLRLAAWLISGKKCSTQAFQNQLPSLSSMPELQAQEAITTQPGSTSLAGVTKNKLIHFNAL